MAKKKPKQLNPLALVGIAAVLLIAAWLMQSLPVFIFVALAPLLAVAEQTDEGSVWSKSELIVIALSAGFWAAALFRMEALVPALVQGIAFALCFVAFAFAKKHLGARLGTLPLLFFWLAGEYVLLKLSLFDRGVFLADSLQLKTTWALWTVHTGYLGISLWILLANFSLHQAVLRGTLHWPFLVAFFLVVVAPFVYNISLNTPGIDRQALEALYGNGAIDSLPPEYVNRGEWISRTAAWISVLILLFALVKSNTRKK